MNRFREALVLAGQSARANLLPGLLLQCLMLLFLAAYVWHDGTQRFLGEVSSYRQQAGYAFAFVSYVVAGAVLPEALRVAFFQKFRWGWGNLGSILVSAPLWGGIGLLVDAFYRLQQALFGAGNDPATLLKKMLFDQFVFSPLITAPVLVGYFFLWENGFSKKTWARIASAGFVLDKILPVQVTAWCVWVPGVSLVYFMPPPLQVPVAVMIQVFWVLLFSTVRARQQKTSGPGNGACGSAPQPR